MKNKKVAYIDIKHTIWDRLKLTADDSNYTAEQLVNIYNKVGLANQIPNELPEDVEWETLYDTSEEITLEENQNNSTVEMFDENGNMLWNNKSGYETNKD